MVYLALIVAAFTASVQNIFKERFNERVKGSAYFFSAMTSFVAMLVFLLTNTDFSYSVELLLPSLAFAFSYALATVFSVLAILHGPLAKTSLILSCSLLIPAAYGILYQGLYLKRTAVEEALSPTLLLGILTLIVTLVLINQRGKEKADKGMSIKWLIFVLLGFLGNGLCSTVQTFKQDFYGNESNGMFMITALFIVALMLSLCAGFSTGERKKLGLTVKKGWLIALLCGAANGITNILVMFMNKNMLSASIMFPVISGGSLLITFLWSVLIKKERFTAVQYTGYALGVVSLILLNL